MTTKLIQLEQRISELERLAQEVANLSDQFFQGGKVQPELSTKGEKWYRGARELLVQHSSSGVNRFDDCYSGGHWTIESVIHHERFEAEPNERQLCIKWFKQHLQHARSLVISLVEEVKSRELPVRSALSFALSADEFDTAQELLTAANDDESLLRAAGVVARVALERHLFTVAESRNIAIQVNPPNKQKPEAADAMMALYKSAVITAIQQSELLSLFKIANNCAHPKETVKSADVRRLIERSRELAALIV